MNTQKQLACNTNGHNANRFATQMQCKSDTNAMLTQHKPNGNTMQTQHKYCLLSTETYRELFNDRYWIYTCMYTCYFWGCLVGTTVYRLLKPLQCLMDMVYCCVKSWCWEGDYSKCTPMRFLNQVMSIHVHVIESGVKNTLQNWSRFFNICFITIIMHLV